MLFIIGYVITGIVVGMLSRGFMVDEPHPTLGGTSLWGILGALFMGGLGKMVGLYSSGSFYGIVSAALGAVISIWIFYSVYRKSHIQKHARSQ